MSKLPGDQHPIRPWTQSAGDVGTAAAAAAAAAAGRASAVHCRILVAELSRLPQARC